MQTLLLQAQVPDSNPIGGFFLLLVLVLFYFLPSWVGRNKRNATSITLLNLFLGWTLVGWVVALVWATSTDTPTKTRVVVQPAAPAPTVSDELAKLAQLRESGALTQAEFETQKARLLA